MAITNFNTSNQTFRKLMGNGQIYRVPPFQRDYSWTETEWEDLWQDIIGMTEPEGEQGHYMGYLVLQSSDERKHDIIDGQQRMTTLTLIVLAVLGNLNRLVEQNIDADDNKTRIDELRKTYVGYLDPVTLISTSKLTLNRHNDRYYQTYILPLAHLPKRNLKASEHLMRKGFEWFEERVRGRFEGGASGADLARFIDIVADRLFFTVISVTDELNAFKVFETLNARGVRLSSTDLLKNYLFSAVHSPGEHENEMRALEEQWESIIDKLGSENVPDFLRVFWNSHKPFTRHSGLFKKIRGSVKSKQDVFDLLRDMDRDADIYAALGTPEDEMWTKEQGKYIAELAMFNIRQPYSLLLVAKRTLDDAEFTRVLRACSIISFRYNVIGNLSPNEQELIYNSAAEKIALRQLSGAADIIQALGSIYPSDEQFNAAFAEKQLRTTTSRNKNVMRYVLFELEKHVSHSALDPKSDKYTIEHILPVNPGDDWPSFSDDQADRCIYRIGNMTLLAAGSNRDMGNAPYDKKKPLFEQSEFEITKSIAIDHNAWGPDRIASRQKWLAKQATSIWRISELST